MYFLLLVAAKTDVFMPVRIDKLPSGACIIIFEGSLSICSGVQPVYLSDYENQLFMDMRYSSLL